LPYLDLIGISFHLLFKAFLFYTMPKKIEIVEGKKLCSKCKEWKELDKFGLDKVNLSGYASRCKKCRSEDANKKYIPKKPRDRIRVDRATQNKKYKYSKEKLQQYNLYKKYKIIPEQYQEMLNQQNHCCAICKKPENSTNSTNECKALAVDHDHDTGENRGLLCQKCNTALGSFKDSIENLKEAIKYLEYWQNNSNFTNNI